MSLDGNHIYNIKGSQWTKQGPEYAEGGMGGSSDVWKGKTLHFQNGEGSENRQLKKGFWPICQTRPNRGIENLK